MKPKKSNKKRFFIALGATVGIVCLVIFLYLFWMLYVPFIGAKTKLINEEKRIGFSHLSMTQAYVGGGCLDNCPELNTYYTISPTVLSAERSKVIDSLQSKGYSIDKSTEGTNDVSATYGSFSIDIGLGANPNSGNNDNTDISMINNVVVLLDYSPQ